MTGIAYWRASGAGNDFLAFAEPAAEPTAAQVAAWCRRGVALGADGVLVLRRSRAGVVDLLYRNADGGVASLCVNGTRCAARLAFDLGWAADSVVVLTGAGPIRAHDRGDTVALELDPPSATPLGFPPAGLRSWRVVVGVPHVVVAVDDLSTYPVAEVGARLRAHPDLGAAGANVNFVRFTSRSTLEVRTFERGVEAETLACGSGILASCAVGWMLGELETRVGVTTRGGFPFQVEGRWDGGGELAGFTLAGDARLVARGEILPGAHVASVAPAWS